MNNDICELSFDELDAVTGGAALRSGNEMSMLDLNSVVAKRSTELTLVTNMMSSMDSGMSGVASKIGH